MRLLVLSSVALATLAACAPTVPNDVAGYDDTRRAQVDRQLAQTDRPNVDSGSTQPEAGTSGGNGGDDIASMAAAALDRSGSDMDNSSGAFPGPSGNAPAPSAVTNGAGISSENDFDAVSAERSIEQDAARVAQNTAQYQQVTPEPLPPRPAGESVNVVEYALRTSNQVGQPIYSRSAFASKSREQRNCADYASADLAQEDFLASGGPERDRKGLDADGDGFACDWNPAPFRRSRG
ncbi:hypothetical protein [Roseivivax sediminis]|uniref:Excalibur calcium-binding domain-containing protein n=1 Tax=Roseivivax sediminis TaxID=936889 RepID=A0A1I1X453_9RHOB|nr:hypothetical protein [Roseivivax sediminis]SFE01408.1 hypothetical protein SAMN04515678_105202 [Roseivivax sediminis]